MSEEWFAALAAHVDQMESQLDPGVALDPEMLTVARRLYEVLGDDDEDLPAWRTLGWFYWQRGMAQVMRGEQLLAEEGTDVLGEALGRCFVAGLDVPVEMIPTAAIGAADRASEMLMTAQQSPEVAPLTAVAQLWQRIIAGVPVNYPLRPNYLVGLSVTLMYRFWRTGDPADLDAAVTVGRQAIETAPDDDADLPGFLRHAGSLLEIRFEQAGDPADLDVAIAMIGRSLDLLPDDDPDRAWHQAALGNFLALRWQHSGDRADLDAAVAAGRQAIRLTPPDDTNLPQIRVMVGETLIMSAGQTGSNVDLDEGITALQLALGGLSDDGPGMARCLSGLNNALRTRFTQTGHPSDLDEAISAGRQAVELTADADPVLGLCLLNLGAALQTRAERDETEADEAEAIAVLERAVAVFPAESPVLVLCLSNLSAVLRSRFQRTKALADVDAAIGYARRALAAGPDDGPSQSLILRNLCIALSDRYERTEVPADLQEALLVGRRMEAAAPDGHPEQASTLSNFGTVLTSGYERTRDPALLDEAIAVHRRAIAALHDGDPQQPAVYNNLGTALTNRFARTEEREDIDEAVALFQAALETPGSAGDGWLLLGLGRALLARSGEAPEPDELDRAVDVLRQAVDGLADHNKAEGQVVLARALRTRFEHFGKQFDLNEAVALSRAAVDAAPADDPNLGAYRATLGQVLAAQETAAQAGAGWAAADERAELIATVAMHVERIAPPDLTVTLDATAVGDVRRLTALLDAETTPDLAAWEMIGLFQWVRFTELPREDSQETDEALDAAIHAYVPLFVAGKEIPWRQLPPAVAEEVASGVGANLFDEAIAAPDSARLNRLIDLWRRILQAMPDIDDADRLPYVAVLGWALSMRYIGSGQPGDLEEGITLLRQAVEGTPPESPTWAPYRGALGEALGHRFQASGDPADLDEAVAMTGAAVAAGAGGEEGTALRLQHASTLLARAQSTRDDRDLDSALTLLSEATAELPAESSDRGTALSYLAEALRIRFERAGDEADLERSVSAAAEAVAALPDGHPSHAGAVLNLGVALMMRAFHTGSDSDLDAAIGQFNRGIAANAPGHPVHVLCQANLAFALQLKFLYRGGRADLNAAIDTARQVVNGATAGFLGYAVAAINLGSALVTRFTWDSDERDLDGAIDAARVAFDASRPTSREAGQSLAIMTIALRKRVERIRDRRYLSETMALAQRVLEAIPAGVPDAAMYQAIISASLRRVLYRVTDDPADLDEMIALARRAVELVQDDHLLADKCLGELAAGLQLRYEASGSEADFAEAKTALQHAADVSAASDRAEHLMAQGDLHAARFLRTRNSDDHHRATALYLVVAQDEAGRPWTRISAARMGGVLAAKGSLPGTAADTLEIAVLQLPLMVPRQLARSDQQRALSEYAFLASDAAALRLEAGGEDAAARALGLLELGRAVLQGQALDMRQDLIALHVDHPALAEEFVRLRDLLDAPTDASVAAVALGAGRATAGASRATPVAGPGRHAAADKFAVLLGRIRALDKFTSFLLPPPPGELTAQADRGPIAVFNISRYRCDALVVTEHAITQVPLPEITFEALTSRVDSFNDALITAKNAQMNRVERIRAEMILSETLEWLWDVAVKPVLDHLGHGQAREAGKPWPRVWLVPGGLLGMLPLHAAGYHRSGTGETALDRVISSYAPTVRALTYARSRGTFLPPKSALIVAMPVTPGQSDLQGVTTEAAKLRERLPSPTTLIERPGVIDESTPTRDAVMERLTEAAIAHFACHAASHPTDPSRSEILLHDYREHPFTVASLASTRLHQAQLAYLSACETARNQVTDLADEAIHLTSAFQLAGYPHVIGTLWTINDAVAVDIAETFYAGLEWGQRLDLSRSAAALHHAIRSVRDRRDFSAFPSLWAAFTHTGA